MMKPAQLFQPISFTKRSSLRCTFHWIMPLLLCLSLLLPTASALASSVRPVPVILTQNELNLPVNTSAVIDWQYLQAWEAGVPDTGTIYTIVSSVQLGTLKNGETVLVNGSTFTQADINAGTITYDAPENTGTDTFTFFITGLSEPTSSLTFKIHVNKPEPTIYPTAFSATAESISQITVTWTDAPADADGYLILCSPNTPPNLPTDTSTPINNSCADGSGAVHLEPGIQTYTWEGLSSETTYHFAIFPYAHTLYDDLSGEYYDYRTAAEAPLASVATFPTYSISGMVISDSGPLMGARVITSSGLSTTTGEDGTYSFNTLTPGEYLLSVEMACYTFDPIERPVTVSELNNHISGQDFTATRLPCIQGYAFSDGQPLSGVTISDGSQTVTTTEEGHYFFAVARGWSGDLFPALTNYWFSPDRRTYLNITADRYLQNYSAHRLDVFARQFLAEWNPTPGAYGYYLDVATDPDFTDFVSGYQNREVGNTSQFMVTGLEPHSRYYYRVRAHNSMELGDSSNPVEVFTPLGFYIPLISR